MAISDKAKLEMRQVVIKSALNAIIATLSVVALVFLTAYLFNYELLIDGFTVILVVVGSFLAIVGNGFIANAATRFGAKDTPLWVWGNRIQMAGFMITILAALL